MSNFKKEIKDKALYIRYKGIKARCYRKNHIQYKNYGAKGIIMCDEWKNNYYAFQDWAYSNGYKRELQIDRINNNGNYEPSNCHWVTPKQNCNNKSDNHYIEYLGVTKTLTEWAYILNANYNTLRAYINEYKYDIELAFVLSFNDQKGSRLNGNIDFDENRNLMNNFLKNVLPLKTLKIKKENKDAILPKKAHKEDMYDCFSNVDIVVNSFESSIISLGILLDIPKGYRVKIFSRSSLPLKKKIIISNGCGIIDPGYKGVVNLICHSLPQRDAPGDFLRNNPITIKKGDKIAQMQLEKIEDFEIEEVEELDMSNDRGGGLGSTGTR